VFTRWRLLSTLALIGTAAAALAVVGTALAIGLSSQDKTAITPLPAPSAAPAPPANGATAEPAPADVPAPPITDASPPVETEAPRVTAQASPPAAVAPAHPVAPLAPRRAAAPPIPGVNGPIPGLDRVNQIIQEIEGGLGIGAFAPSH
jgi:hypothetical protein